MGGREDSELDGVDLDEIEEEAEQRGDEEEAEMFALQSTLVTEWAQRTGRGPVRTPLPGTGGEKRS